LFESIKSTWLEKDVSIVTNDWSDPQIRPLINFMVVSKDVPMFVKVDILLFDLVLMMKNKLDSYGISWYKFWNTFGFT